MKKIHPFDLEVTHLLQALKEQEPGTEAYSKMVDDLKKLSEAQQSLAPKLNKDHVVTILASFAEVLVMLNYEVLHNIGSKTLSRIIKPRL